MSNKNGNNNGSNGAKAFGGIMAVGTLATFGWMLWQAQSSRSDTLERLTNQRLDLIDSRMESFDKHTARNAHSVAEEWTKQLRDDVSKIDERDREVEIRDREKLTTIERLKEQLNEVETQFGHMDKLIQLLWGRVYQEPLSNPPDK